MLRLISCSESASCHPHQGLSSYSTSQKTSYFLTDTQNFPFEILDRKESEKTGIVIYEANKKKREVDQNHHFQYQEEMEFTEKTSYFKISKGNTISFIFLWLYERIDLIHFRIRTFLTEVYPIICCITWELSWLNPDSQNGYVP